MNDPENARRRFVPRKRSSRIEDSGTGRVIDLHQAGTRIRAGRRAPSAGARAGDLASALSNCMMVRRQIGAALEVTVVIEEMIEQRADRESRRELRDRLWTSRKELMTAFKNVSATVEVLSQMLAGRSQGDAAPSKPIDGDEV